MKKNIQIHMDTLIPPALLLLAPWIKAQKKRNRTKTNFWYGGEEMQNTGHQDAEARE